ncbi:MAG: hypothetical protein MUC87_08750 [Bacteroidia bacterium]|nr:hypothetical protein [Bacteroidia bacterium]
MKKATILLFITISLAACRRGYPSWETGIGVPVAHGSFGINQLIADSLTSAGANGTVYIDHTFSLDNIGMDTLFDIPDTTLRYVYPAITGSTIPPGNAIWGQNTTTRYQLGAIQLMSSTLREGIMRVAVKNDIDQPLDLQIILPCATRNSQLLDTVLIVPAAYSPTSAFRDTFEINLSGYSIDMRGPLFNQVNTITIQYNIKVSTTATASANIIQWADSVAMNMTFTGIKPEYVRGYFGNQNLVAGPEETETGIFDLITAGTFGLDSMKMELELENYVGMDARVRINSLWSRNSGTGQTVYMTGPVIGPTYNFNRATYSYGTPPSLPSRFTTVLDNSNSNMRAMVENMPDHFGYHISIETNPLGNVSGSNDFLFTDWGINAKMHMLMPLSFHSSQLTLADTLDVDLTAVENPDAVGSGALTVYAQNGFPFQAAVQLYLLDAAGNITDVLVAQPNVIAQAPLTSMSTNMFSNGTTPSILHIPLTAEQSQRVLSSSKVLTRVVFDTNSAPYYVRIRTTDRLDLRITADFNYTFGN